jgi:hypothetical protein
MLHDTTEFAFKRDKPDLIGIIHALERESPKNRKKLEWKLITDLPVRSRQDVIEKLEWYAMRWKIEIFHKILKSGARRKNRNSEPPSGR